MTPHDSIPNFANYIERQKVKYQYLFEAAFQTKLAYNGLLWRSTGNSLIVWPALMINKNAMLNYPWCSNENGPAPNQTCNIADDEVTSSSPVFCQCIVIRRLCLLLGLKTDLDLTLFTLLKVMITIWELLKNKTCLNERIEINYPWNMFVCQLPNRKALLLKRHFKLRYEIMQLLKPGKEPLSQNVKTVRALVEAHWPNS